MTRLILLTGMGGAGTSTLAGATAASLRDEGLTVALVDGSGSVVDAECAAPFAEAWEVMSGELGGDPLDPLGWAGLPGLAALTAVSAAVRAAAEHDVVVLDAGPHARAREIAQAPSALVRILDAAMTPRLAMWRSTRGDRQVFDALSTARAAAVRLEQALLAPATTIRLATPATVMGAERTLRALAVFSMLGVGVDGIVATRTPRKSAGATAAERDAADAIEEALVRSADGVAVWRAGAAWRSAPKGYSALGPFGRTHRLDASDLTVHAGDEELALDLPLAPVARTDARVGALGPRLLVTLDDAVRWLDLPSVLQRCSARRAVRTATGWRVEFEPDPAVWRQTGRAS